ncbi:hypothetical protein D8O01_19790, partial [Acinetobacter baumannii]
RPAAGLAPVAGVAALAHCPGAPRRPVRLRPLPGITRAFRCRPKAVSSWPTRSWPGARCRGGGPCPLSWRTPPTCSAAAITG